MPGQVLGDQPAREAGGPEDDDVERAILAHGGQPYAELELMVRLMARTYKLNYFNKGTGAAVEPLDDSADSQSGDELRTVPMPPLPRKRKIRGEKISSPLPPGHVRKKATGEIGRVQSVDSKAGTATVLWLRRGQASTVPLAAISRR